MEGKGINKSNSLYQDTMTSISLINGYYYFCDKCFSPLQITLGSLSKKDNIEIVCTTDDCPKYNQPSSLSIIKFISSIKEQSSFILDTKNCSAHKKKLKFFCRECRQIKCQDCLKECKINRHTITEKESLFDFIEYCEQNYCKNKVEFYCANCQKNICDFCRNPKHSNHTIINLINFLTNKIYKKIIGRIENAESVYKSYPFLVASIKKEYKSDKDKNIKEKLNQLDIYSNKNIQTNNELLEFFSFINRSLIGMTSKKLLNYNIMNNFKTNVKITSKKISPSNDMSNSVTTLKKDKILDDLINQFKTNFIYDDEASSVSDESENENQRVEVNLTEKYAIMKHFDEINNIIVLFDYRICSCSSDGTIKIFNAVKRNNIDITIKVCEQKVLYVIELSNNDFEIIVSCSEDDIIRLYEIEGEYSKNCKLIHTIPCNDVVKVTGLPESKFAACTKNSKIYIYDFLSEENFKKPMEIKHPGDSSLNILYIDYSKQLASCDVCKYFCLWDLENLTYDNMTKYAPEVKIEDIECSGMNCMYEMINKNGENILIIGGWGGINIYNLISKKMTYEAEYIEQVNTPHCFLQVMNGFFFCGTSTNSFVLLDCNCDILNIKYNPHELGNDDINCMVIVNDNCIASCSGKTIKIWEYGINLNLLDEDNDDKIENEDESEEGDEEKNNN